MQDNKLELFTEKLEKYKSKLLGLQKSNRCICLSKLYKNSSFDLSRLAEDHPKEISQIVEQSLKRKKPVCILPDSDDSEEADKMRTRLKSLSRTIKQIEDETGSQYCYFGYPFLEGHITREYYVRGPLVLFPISIYHGIKNKKMGWYVEFVNSSPILNHTLFAALEKIGGYKINESLEEDFENSMSDTYENLKDQFIKSINDLLKKNGITAQIHADDEDLILQDMKRAEIDALQRKKLGIYPYKIIGSFPQGENAIYQDYENLIETVQGGEGNEFLEKILDASIPNVDSEHDVDDDESKIMLDDVRDRDLNMILESDASQDRVVLDSQNQKITVVRGPPGTGKSQVIVNIISNALSKNQTVLVVCQKRAALDVVHQRLGKKNIGKYAVLLNREKEDRAKMYQQLKQIIDESQDLKEEQETIEYKSSQIDEQIKKHAEIAYALSKEFFGGKRVGNFYTKSCLDYNIKSEFDGIVDYISTHTELDEFLSILDNIKDNYKRFENPDYSWKNRKEFTQKDAQDQNKIREILKNILKWIPNCVIVPIKLHQLELALLASKHEKYKCDIEELDQKIKKCKETIQEITADHDTIISFDKLEDSIKCTKAGIRLWEKFHTYDQIIKVRKEFIQEDTIKKQKYMLEAFVDPPEQKSFWKRHTNPETKLMILKKKIFVGKKNHIDKNLDELKNALKNGLDLWELVSKDIQKQYIFERSFVLDDQSKQNSILENLKSLDTLIVEHKACHNEMASLKESIEGIFDDNGIKFDENCDLVSMTKNGTYIHNSLDDLTKFVTDQEVDSIKSKYLDIEKFSNHIQNLQNDLDDFDRLQAFDIDKSKLKDTHKIILDKCNKYVGLDEDWTHVIRQEMYNRWIAMIEKELPQLKSAYFDDYKDHKNRLEQLLKEKSDLLVRKIIADIESNARHNKEPAMYGKLSHQLGKKRLVKPIRKLLEEYQSILFRIAPCWLATPEMVAKIFPLKRDMFDIIIVDEASQLAAERAIPCLHRGKKIIIAGDEKQLKPHDLFRVKNDEEQDEEDDVQNIESLLVLVNRQYRHRTRSLLWHYRSKWQELIDFSNYAFYNGGLQVSPNESIKASSPPIQWVQCPNGIWEGRANVVEASLVVDTLYKTLQEYTNKTIGIITFNDQQRNTILDEIEVRQKKDPAFEEMYQKIENPPSGKKDEEIFVRNIENVQGDERDIIIFSVGYAKDVKGSFRLQFGTLNQDGGENRLNVAITRASRKIIVVCSIDPRDMKVENTKNPGPKRLKDFLMYANAVSTNDEDQVNRILDSLNSAIKTKDQIKLFDSDFEEQVHDRLESIGYTVKTQIGQSGYRIDLAVVHPDDPNRYILGIECDGATFHSAKSVRERDVMRQKFLERRGWKIERIWSRKWWRNPDAEIKRIEQCVNALKKNSK